MAVSKEIWELDHEPPKLSVVYQRCQHPVNGRDIALRCLECMRKPAEEFDDKLKVFILSDVIDPSLRMDGGKRSVIKRGIHLDAIEELRVEFQLPKSFPGPGGIEKLSEGRQIPPSHSYDNFVVAFG